MFCRILGFARLAGPQGVWLRFCEILKEPGTALGSKGCAIVEYSSAREARDGGIRRDSGSDKHAVGEASHSHDGHRAAGKAQLHLA